MTSSAPWRERLDRPVGGGARRALAIVFVALVLFNAVKAHRNAASGVTSDLRTYYTAAADIRDGRSPYQHRDWLNDYIYPPFFCWGFSPLTLVPIEWAAALWAVANGALWLAAAALALDAAPLAGWWAVLPSIFALRFLLNNWGHGQVNLLLLALVLAALACLRRGRPLAAGTFLGAAVAVKVIPALFVALHVWRREWRVVGAAVLAALLFIAAPALTAGPSAAGGYVSDWLEMFGRHTTDLGIYTSAKNQSLFGCLMRYLTPVDAVHYQELRGFRVNVAELAPATVARLFLLVVSVLAAAAAWRLRESDDLPLEYALVFLSLPLLSKTAMEHHWVMLLFVYTVLLGRAATGPALLMAVGAAVVMTNAYSTLFLGRVWASRIQALSPATAAVLLLWGVVWSRLGRPGALPEPSSAASDGHEPSTLGLRPATRLSSGPPSAAAP